MPLRSILKKSERAKKSPEKETVITPILFMRSDTKTEEIIYPPSYPDHEESKRSKNGKNKEKKSKRLLGRWCSVPRTPSESRKSSLRLRPNIPVFEKISRHLHRKSRASDKVPENLPDIEIIADQVERRVEKRINEIRAQWEKRATILAKKNEESTAKYLSINDDRHAKELRMAREMHEANSANDNIIEAIRLHEAGELHASTMMFGRLAEFQNENNTLSQVLYGLSLRHGWGCTPDPEKALEYLSAAASCAASIEDLALKAGRKSGGAAKDELVLALYELANSFRHGWGIPIDRVAAKQYYETAANLGDTDAMNEVARCYAEGFGCKKDMFVAAKYYRMAENEGNKIIGNSWIWKAKYNAPMKVTFKD
ncbi:putative protein dsf2 [Golovinomyces cichoracearum]|uniref:Protein DSF2 n=1 Tax=Golovinomyces cichoracearum TaxID=62708 RepID=A0A420IVE4_9PEZI|nr:putative protein dsf2 [Golovinomyces cichoracearum]